MSKYKGVYCSYCQRNVRGEKPSANHILHLVLTILSCGGWLVIWLLMILNAGCYKHQCPYCGSTCGKMRLEEV